MKKEVEHQENKNKEEIPAAENSTHEDEKEFVDVQVKDDCTDQTAEESQGESGDKSAENQDDGSEQTPQPEKEKSRKAKRQERNLKSEIENLQKKLDETTGQLEKQKNLFVRTMAEYDNYRKRTEREKSAIYSDATAAAVKEVLAVEDNLSRALAQKDCNAEDMRKGVEMVEKGMRAALEKLGVTEMGKVGEPFDPEFHSAVSHIEDENAEDNTITQVLQKGYKLNDKIIRHAMVQVVN